MIWSYDSQWNRQLFCCDTPNRCEKPKQIKIKFNEICIVLYDVWWTDIPLCLVISHFSSTYVSKCLFLMFCCSSAAAVVCTVHSLFFLSHNFCFVFGNMKLNRTEICIITFMCQIEYLWGYVYCYLFSIKTKLIKRFTCIKPNATSRIV